MRPYGQGQRRKTVLIVTIAVILVIIAMLAGAFIARHKLQSNAADGSAVQVVMRGSGT